MEDTLVQDLIEIKEVEDRPVFGDRGAREYVIEQSMVAAIPEPYIGMEFKSPDDAQQYYNNYARSKGFGTRKNRISRSKINKAMIAREFVCSKEGLRANKYVKREDRVTVAPDEIREGCKAMILVSKKEEGKWIVSRFHTEHNHALASPMSTRFIRSHRTKTKVQKDLMDVLDDSGIRPSKIASILSHESGGLGNLNMTEHDIFNYLSRKRQKQLEKGDAQIMLDYFRGCQSKNPEALDDRYNKEREENFKTMNSKPVMKTLYPMEAEASLIYTRKLFRIFQDELIHAQECVASRVDVNDGLKVYKVHGFNKEKPMYMVTFDASQNAAVCNCHKFEFMGILCRHILAIFIKKKVFSLPSQYIIRRWTKDAKKNDNSSIIQNETDDKLSESSTLWFNSVMLHSLGLSEKATRSSKHYDLAIRGIKNLCDELDTLAIDIVNEGKKPASIDDSRMLEDDNVLYSGTTLRDPVHVISKGRPPSLRKKSSVEESSKKSKTCSSCNRKGHTKRTCERHQPNFESKSISTSQIVDVTQD
ncbi:hypothetical protein V6N12_060209 [Hibiscus sabdariffa]|uniref:SWIM-type domain-containing protein n=1 Tax=Hibiscus sabdariffa TaxID=183260 RepID=A0ABR2D3R6_9ROSI